MGGAVAGFAGVEFEVFVAPYVGVGCAFWCSQRHFGSLGVGPTGVEPPADGAVACDYEIRLFQNFECDGAAVAGTFDHLLTSRA